jgi:hypothetical protein
VFPLKVALSSSLAKRSFSNTGLRLVSEPAAQVLPGEHPAID